MSVTSVLVEPAVARHTLRHTFTLGEEGLFIGSEWQILDLPGHTRSREGSPCPPLISADRLKATECSACLWAEGLGFPDWKSLLLLKKKEKEPLNSLTAWSFSLHFLIPRWGVPVYRTATVTTAHASPSP